MDFLFLLKYLADLAKLFWDAFGKKLFSNSIERKKIEERNFHLVSDILKEVC